MLSSTSFLDEVEAGPVYMHQKKNLKVMAEVGNVAPAQASGKGVFKSTSGDLGS